MLLGFPSAFLLSTDDFILLSLLLSDTLQGFNANCFKLSVSEAESHQVNILISIFYKEVLGTAQSQEDG